jgi:Transcription factor WhiB
MMFLSEGAVCVDYVRRGKDYWFGRGDKQTLADVNGAKMLCSGCPVLAACLTRTLAMPVLPTAGVWAGKTAEELARTAEPGEWRTCVAEGCVKMFHVRKLRSTKRFCTTVCVHEQTLLNHERMMEAIESER